jgi:hypothetical protein
MIICMVQGDYALSVNGRGPEGDPYNTCLAKCSSIQGSKKETTLFVAVIVHEREIADNEEAKWTDWKTSQDFLILGFKTL